LAAIALKLTGSAAAEAATVSADLGGEGEGQDKKIRATFFSPGRYNISTLNSEIKAKWHCWRGEIGTETWVKAVTSGFDQPKAGKILLHKNGENDALQQMLQTIPGQK
jgi:hypothetical protein